MVYRYLGLADLTSGIIALVVSFFAYKCYTTINDRRFLLLELSFLVMGLGMGMRGFSLIIASKRTLHILMTCILIEAIARIVSYIILAVAYTMQLMSSRTMLIGIYLLRIFILDPIVDTIAIFLLSYVVFNIGMTLFKGRSKLTLIVFIAFFLLTLSHMFSIIGHYIPSLFYVTLSYLTQLSSFILLLIMLLRVG